MKKKYRAHIVIAWVMLGNLAYLLSIGPFPGHLNILVYMPKEKA